VAVAQHGTLVTIVSALNGLFPSLRLCILILTVPMCGCVTVSVMPVAIGLDRLCCVLFPIWLTTSLLLALFCCFKRKLCHFFYFHTHIACL
jgi:hypothetical protein